MTDDGREDAPLHPIVSVGERALAESELDDIEQRLEQSRKRVSRHMVWLLLGVSPGAFVPMIYALTTVGASALLAVLAVGIVVESWRAIGTRREIRGLEIERADAHARLAATHPTPSDPGEPGATDVP